ncbi:CPBP family intramembrane metalloprotease [Salegentibacter mishustinae]|uniref:CPBP family intramembrane glutamic endopeptidase n=1 Tax=Salegentibacter mishustinae TaxID=270918 RepID=UPI001CE0B3EB|nr:type II CAAX endopeptidase family protein [Salegentibacter mishustinae]UBZ07088.1 CPBP family intramembrane metalloprotease [Salegentibacter mishustinae]
MERDDQKMGWIRVLLLIFPYVIIVGIFQIIGYIMAGISFEEELQPTTTQSFILTIATLLATLTVLYVFMRFVEKRKFKELGLKIKDRGFDLHAGVIIVLVVMATGFFLLIVLNEINVQNFNLDLEEVLLSIGVFTAVSISEELLCRGYIQRNLMYSFNNYIALIISSLLFALAHSFNPNLSWIALAGLFGAGILLGLSYIYTKNLWFPISLHFSWNLFQAYFGFNVSGQEFYSIVEFNIAEENILNGGKFGFEASIFSLILQIALILLIFRYYQKRKNLTENS